MDEKLIARFWKYVDKRGTGECWPWIGECNADGYGRFRIKAGAKRKSFGAHRISWEFAHGTIPPGQSICHRCDNPPCCNPAHLFSGTNHDNVRDMVEKGRQYTRPMLGDENGRAVLTLDQVVRIRREYVRGLTRQADIAARLGVSQVTISAVILGKTWR